MALQSTQTSSINGLELSFGAVSSSDTFVADERVVAIYTNNSGGNLTVTVIGRGTPRGLDISNVTSTTIANGETAIIGPFDRDAFESDAGFITINPSTTSSVTVAIVKM